MKKFLSVLLVLLSFAVFMPSAFAYDSFVDDTADLLTDDEESSLVMKIMAMQNEYNVDVALHTTMSIGDEDIHSYAENYYLSNGFSADGLVFVINLNNNEVGNRDFYTYYQGSVYDTFGDEAYNSDYGTVNQAVLPYLANEDYYSAFKEYLNLTESYLSGQIITDGSNDYYVDDYYGDSYYEDEYYYENSYSSPPNYVIREIVVIAIGVGIAFLITYIMKSKMNTAVIKKEASDYVKAGSMKVTRSLDIFTHRHVTRTAKPKNNSSSGGSRSGGGFSGGGGGRSGGGGGKF